MSTQVAALPDGSAIAAVIDPVMRWPAVVVTCRVALANSQVFCAPKDELMEVTTW